MSCILARFVLHCDYMRSFTYANQVLPYLNSLYGRKNIAEFRRYDAAIKEFGRVFGGKSVGFVSAPGRVEFIGNHLDHNGGKVIACTVNLDIVAAFAPTDNNVIRIAGKGRSTLRVPVGDFEPCYGSAGLIKGVVQYLSEHGYSVGGFDAYTDSTIPTGAGISSSAAFELAVGTILSELYNGGGIPSDVLARAGQFAENVFFSKPCGLLDQSVIAIGGVVALDFSDGLRYTRLDGNLDGLSLALVNSGGSHAFLSEMYAAIPADMRAVARFFGRERLIDLPPDEFFARYFQAAKSVGEDKVLRAKHFFDELARVEQMQTALCGDGTSDGGGIVPDRAKILSLINDSGDSSLTQLKNCAVNADDTAIADIVAFVRSVCPCAARVHGGGFAGTVLCVVPDEYFGVFFSEATAKYGSDRVLPLRLRFVGATVL